MMARSEIVACIIFGVAVLLLIALSIALMMGRGAWLIAGYNTLGNKEKAQYDIATLCRFTGKSLLSIGLLMPAVPVGAILKINWLTAVYAAYVLISAIFVIAYCNTGNRFKKSI